MIRCLIPLALAATLAAQGQTDRWTRMLRRDRDRDGKISKEEFPGPERLFDRLDTNGDGFVTEPEANAMRGRGGSMRLAQRFDADDDGQVTRKEWDAFFDRADDNGDGILDREEVMAALSGRRYRDTAPQVGDEAPAVKARRAQGDGEVDLSRVRRPTVLVFGSWT
ncbi:MAG: EF-hand domain-containing protein [Planctomycetota bacterium]|jgi:Ca2+-binding EF-hand superfamily protein